MKKIFILAIICFFFQLTRSQNLNDGITPSRLSFERIKEDCIFFRGDSLDGFALEAELNKIFRNQSDDYSEQRSSLYYKEIAFVKNKYHVSKLPIELALERNSIHPNTPLSAACLNLGFDDSNNFSGWSCYLGYHKPNGTNNIIQTTLNNRYIKRHHNGYNIR